MKPKSKLFVMVFLNVCLLASICLTGLPCFSDEMQIYQEKDQVAEKKKYVRRLTEDNQKVDLAIKTTKQLIHKSSTKPYLPELYLRLAELYIEKSRLVYFLKRHAHPGAVKSLEKVESNILKNQALEIYQRILNNFPNFPDRDKVYFFMAHEYRELGKHEDMAAQYRTLVNTYKKSVYVPECYLLLGDYAIAHQSLDEAKRNYTAVLDYPKSSAVAIARYKLGWCHINTKDFKKALALFEACVAASEAHDKIEIDTYKRINVKFEALIDLAYCYSEVYKDKAPEEALVYFQKRSWSRPVYVAVLEKLANRFFIKKKWLHAATVYRQLATLSNDAENLLEYTRNIFECERVLNKFTYADNDVRLIIKALKKQQFSIHFDDADKKKNLDNYEKYARNIITDLHEKARLNKSKEDFKRAAVAYEYYLDFFEKSPVRNQMQANNAEALFSSKQYIKAGKQYEICLADYMQEDKKIKKDKAYQEWLYGAIIAYYNALKSKETLNYYQTVYARAGLRTRGNQYVAEFPKAKNVRDVFFNVAWVTYDEGKYDEAITSFDKFITRFPTGKSTAAAVHLVMDSYYLKEDYEGLAAYGKKVINNPSISDKALRSEIQKIVAAAESKVISRLTLAVADDYQKGSQQVLDFIEKGKMDGLNEQALQVLLATSKEKADFPTMLSAGEKMVTSYPNSSKVGDTLKLLVDTSLNAAQFRLVARYLEMYATRFQNRPASEKFDFQAGQIRKNLAQYGDSNNNFNRIIKKTNASEKIETIVFAMVDNALAMNNPNSAIRLLITNKKRFSKVGRIKAYAKLSVLYDKQRNRQKSSRYRDLALKSYRSKYASKDPLLGELMAQMDYDFTLSVHERYMKLQLKGGLDNAVVSKKTNLLQQLEKEYQKIMGYKAPKWALAACFQSYAVNAEFARFLKEAPLPEQLNDEQKKQYETIISQKAEGYSAKAEQYRKTCVNQAHKWEICDPEVVPYYAFSNNFNGKFSDEKSKILVIDDVLKDENLKSLHSKLMADPENVENLISLTNAYLEKGDYRHARMITQKMISETDIKIKPLKSIVYNMLGLTQLYVGNDESAKEAFKEALNLDRQNLGAQINLAGLYGYYQHLQKAEKLYEMLPDTGIIQESGAKIHPRAMEFYYAFKRENKKED